VNEDATLVREDLGLFAVADGAGGAGVGDAASTLVLRSLENHIGQSARPALERADYDSLGIPEQAKRLSSAVHAAQRSLLELKRGDAARADAATTIAALLFSPRTDDIHLASVGDSRIYRVRHGRLELLTVDHTVATDVLERQPDLSDDILATVPRNAVVRALGSSEDFRVSMRTVPLVAGDRFLLCTDGLSSTLDFDALWRIMRAPGTSQDLASELLAQALAWGSSDNISVVVVDVTEVDLQEDYSTRRYNDIPDPPSLELPAPLLRADAVDSARLAGPEVVGSEFIQSLARAEQDGVPVSEVLLERGVIEISSLPPPSDHEPPPES